MTRAWLARLLAVVLAASSLMPVAEAQAPGTRERQIRAALVYKVARFVTWPENVLPARTAFTFCYISDDPTSQVLAGIEGRAIQNRRTRMRRIDTLDAGSLNGCNLLYLAGKATLAPDLVNEAVAAATLVVADGPRVAANATMVQLLPRDNRVTLSVDLGMVRAARLRIDATLLQLVEIRQ
jgi:hypothetical protein